MKRLSHRFFCDESGAPAIEYGLIAGLVSLGIIAGASQFPIALNDFFEAVREFLDTAVVS